MDNIAKENLFGNKLKYIWVVVLVVALILSLTLYFLGYRFKDNFTLGKIGTLTMTIPLPQTLIFIDNSEKIQTKIENEVVNISLSPKTHSIIIGRDRYYPWTKDFVVPSNGKVILSPIFVSQNASGQMITKNDPEYWSLRNKIRSNTIPTKNNPLLSSDKSISLWVENNTIFVKNASSTTQVVKPETSIKNVSFYKNRNDAVIFSSGNSVYVIETDTSSIQNFMPIYKGISPEFMEDSNDFIYILDEESLMQVII